MQTENHDLFSEKRNRNSQIVSILTSYCRRYRMTAFDVRRLPASVIQELAGEVIDFFEDRIRKELAGVPPSDEAPLPSRKPKRS